jgi:hypothetical protein
MRMILVFGILIISMMSCNSQPTEIKEETNIDLKSIDLSNIIKTFNSISNEVDNVYNKDTTKLELYLQMDKEGLIKKVPNYDDPPESFYASYNLIRNKSGQIIYIAEYPVSESGDWNLIYENYFDFNGNLIAFIRKCSFFNGECAEIVHERSDYYYNLKHELIKKTYEITDGDKNPLDYKKCVFNYRYDYKIYTSLTEYLENNKYEK